MRTLPFIISLFICFVFVNGYSQKQPTTKVKKDSIIYKTGYGLRLGIDISKPVLSIFDKSYGGLEIVGDYRISRRWYIATELGYEDEIVFENVTTSSTSGSYVRLGANYNAYDNWLDMNNEIYVGGRYGFSFFNQTLKNYTPNSSSYFPPKTIENPIKTDGLTGHWIEFQLGIKAETFKNLFIGFHGSYKIGINIKNPDNFKTLYAPGFNRVYKSGTGFGFNYTISYLIPFTKK